MASIHEGKRAWLNRLSGQREGGVDQTALKKTLSGIEVNPLYTPLDRENSDYLEKVGFPGEFPFTRGVYDSMYRGKPWTIRQFAGLGTPDETNKRFRYLLERGQAGLSVAFDLPTLMGCDSDSPLSKGEVGKCGVAIDTLEDMETLFRGIPLEKITTSMTINAPAATLYAMIIVLAKKRGINLKNLGGTIQNDILKEYIAQKEWIFPPEAHLKIITDTIRHSAHYTPNWHPISISGYHIREAGATAVQELAFTLYDGLTYVEEFVKSGMGIDEFAPRLSFFFDVHNDFFEEVAKFRAARRIWAGKIKKRYSPKNPASSALRFHAQTAGCSLTAEQPYNNIVRVALQALAGVLGGTQSLHTDSMDETFFIPSEDAVTVALRTQQIIAEETGVKNTIDPLGGSYYIETLTDRMEEECYRYFAKLDEMGGMVEAIKAGFPQNEIRHAALDYQLEVDKKKRTVVGVNDFLDSKQVHIPGLNLDPAGEESQLKRLFEIKKSRESRKTETTLDRLKKAADRGVNLMPFLIDAVSCYATVGEISSVLKDVYGGYSEPGLSKRTLHSNGAKKVLLCKIGQDGHDRGVMILKAYLSEKGFDTIYSGLRMDPEMIVNQAVSEDVSVIGVSMLSGAHRTWIPQVLTLLKKRNREDMTVIGGGIIPEEDIPLLKKSGLKRVFPPGTPLETISDYLRQC